MGTLNKGDLFPKEVVNDIINLVTGKSSIAKLCQKKPILFNGNEIFKYNFDNEADIVGESGAKGVGGSTIDPVIITPYKIEYGTRVSDEFMIASEESRINILGAFKDAFSRKIARALDIMAFHGLNPRTGLPSSIIGNNHMDYAVQKTVTRSSSASADVEAAIALVPDNEVNALAMSPAFRAALAGELKSNGDYLFPELSWGANPDTIKGLSVDMNDTVIFGVNNEDEAIIGNFRDFFVYGIAKDIGVKIIEYGNPDNSTDGDLQGHNQVYIRGEVYIGYGILVPSAFVRIGNFQ